MSTSIRNKSHIPKPRSKAKTNSGNAVGADSSGWLRQLSDTWIADLRRCLDDAGVEEVHRVRTGTRRLEAQLESFLELKRPGKGRLSKGASNWTKQMKRIRRAAGSVRDLDVHRELMEKFTGVGKEGRKLHDEGKQSEVERSTPTPQGIVTLEDQAETLDHWLCQQREDRAGSLRKQIEKRLPRVEDKSAHFFEAYAVHPQKTKSSTSPEQMALDAFARLSAEMPQLNALNLHDFRKKAKKARYLTESANPTPQAEKIGKMIKKIQDVIGDWHDWLALSDEAKVALGDKQAELVLRLEEQMAGSYKRAQSTTEELRRRLLKAPSNDDGIAKKTSGAKKTGEKGVKTKRK